MILEWEIDFFCDKKEKFLKTLLTCTYIPLLLNSFDLPSEVQDRF